MAIIDLPNTVNNNSKKIDLMEELAPGFRFYPTEEELVTFYLRNKLEGKRQDLHRVIPVVDIYNIEPCHLPRMLLHSLNYIFKSLLNGNGFSSSRCPDLVAFDAGFSGELCRGDTEQWFFFAPRQEREARGGRPSRTTASGYWKATGSPSYVYSSNSRVIGMKKTMVFYKGKAPTGRKTKWKMNEYRAIEEAADSSTTNSAIPVLRHEFTLCRVYVISGSFRAFDRRPLEAGTREIQVLGDTALTSAPVPTVEGNTSPSDTSNSGGDHAHLQVTAGTENSGMTDAQDYPFWDWEQLNWT